MQRLSDREIRAVFERRLQNLADMKVCNDTDAEIVSWEVFKLLSDPTFNKLSQREKEELFFRIWFSQKEEKVLETSNV